MPPFIPQKRRHSTPPPETVAHNSAKRRNIFDTADKATTSTTLQDNKAFLDTLNAPDDDSSLSETNSVEFEDAIVPTDSKKRKTAHHQDEDDEINWEDAIEHDVSTPTARPLPPSGDLEITLGRHEQTGSLTNPHDKKKGPSKIERQIRTSTHCMHVQFLLFHNLIRNGWACDKEAQQILVDQLPPAIKSEVEKWRVASGIVPGLSPPKYLPSQRRGKKGKRAAQLERNQRDWGKPAERQERGAPDMSRGDPVLRLLKILAAYWKKHFIITSPSLRKKGYKPLPTLEEEIASWRDDRQNAEEYGERIETIKEFREKAKTCEGSKDVGAQLFTALIRGLGLEARMVASLQPIGFGWSKNEDAMIGKKRQNALNLVNGDLSENISAEGDSDEQAEKTSRPATSRSSVKRKHPSMSKRGRPRGGKDAPIKLSDGADSKGDPSTATSDDSNDDNSVIDITPGTPRRKPNAKYDRDMPAPTYWTEAISPVTNEVHPVDPVINIPAVVTSPEHLALFEPRGTKADKAKQIFAYVIAYSLDGTAKEVTTRYLKRHMWPGRTKGVRMPVEKLPVYNRRGKIKRYEEYDWFKTVLSSYERAYSKRTAADDLEESKDLKPVKPEKKEKQGGEETLQGYKNSAEFVLQRHLRREEALGLNAKSVRSFTTGKGDKAQEEPVYLRKDVEICRTAESWHKEGRAIKEGEHPMKKVPVRAVTTNRKREVEEAERDGGEKLMQGMYARNQTDWIIPPPIENGVIPKNAFGNMDCYVPSMVPKGAVHIPLRSTVKVCKRLGIDYAEAVTGFEFGKRMAVPIITGVVIAQENEKIVLEEWERDETERRIKEEGKREKQALGLWRKWLMGLRVIQRVKEEYSNDADAHLKEEINPFTNKSKAKQAYNAQADVIGSSNHEKLGSDNEVSGGGFIADDEPDGGAGGFFPEGYEEEEKPITNGDLTIDGEDSNLNSRRQLAPSAPANSERGPAEHPSGGAEDISDINDVVTEMRKVSSKTRNPKPPAKRGRKRKGQSTADQHDHGDPNTPAISPEEMSPQAAPKRRSARSSAKGTKSRYFEQDSDEDLEGEESAGGLDGDESAFEPPVNEKKKRRGRPSKRKG